MALALGWRQSPNDGLYAYDESNGILTRNSAADLAVPTNLLGGFSIGNRAWVVNLATDMLEAYDSLAPAPFYPELTVGGTTYAGDDGDDNVLIQRLTDLDAGDNLVFRLTNPADLSTVNIYPQL